MLLKMAFEARTVAACALRRRSDHKNYPFHHQNHKCVSLKTARKSFELNLKMRSFVLWAFFSLHMNFFWGFHCELLVSSTVLLRLDNIGPDNWGTDLARFSGRVQRRASTGKCPLHTLWPLRLITTGQLSPAGFKNCDPSVVWHHWCPPTRCPKKHGRQPGTPK